MPRTLHHEIGHVLHLLLHDDTRNEWMQLSEASGPASTLSRRSVDEDWAEYVAALQTRPKWLQRRACDVADVAGKIEFVQQHVLRLGVTFDRPVDLTGCNSDLD
jgi:hypothetical protein